MATFTESDIRAKASSRGYTSLSAKRLLQESVAKFDKWKTYDIFLSHSIKDAELILGVKFALEDLGHSVYVDWIDDPQMDRESVCSETADRLRKRMQTSKALFYVTTENATRSRWMPWECGYFDGHKHKVAILPVTPTPSTEYKGQEYLGLYPYSTKEQTANGVTALVIWRNPNECIPFRQWLEMLPDSLFWQRCR